MPCATRHATASVMVIDDGYDGRLMSFGIEPSSS